MLYLVLGLVLAAFGLLIAALTSANTLFAWLSVTVSVIAAVVLVLDWVRGRRARAATEAQAREPVGVRQEQPFGDQTPPLTETVSSDSGRGDAARTGSRRADLGRDESAEPDPSRTGLSQADPPQTDLVRDDPPRGDLAPTDPVRDDLSPDSPVRDDLLQDDLSRDDLSRSGSSHGDSSAADPSRTGSSGADSARTDDPSQDDLIRTNLVVDNLSADDLPRDDLSQDDSARTDPADARRAELYAELRADRNAGRRADQYEREETGEPGEEPTDAADLLIVADLRAEVRVVDERPRYHLPTCTYLRDKPTIPLPVDEARQLGFTPCVRCGPDAVLAAQHRATR